MNIAEDVKADDAVAALAGELARKTGYISLDSPDKITRGWFLRMARAILAERGACAQRYREGAGPSTWDYFEEAENAINPPR